MLKTVAKAALLASIIFLCTGCPPGRVVPLKNPLVSDKEMEALDMAQLAIDIGGEEGQRIWPGYRPGDYAILIFRPGKRSFLVNPSWKPASLPVLDLPEIEAAVYVLKPGGVKASSGLPFSKEFAVGGGKAFLVRHRDSDKRQRWFRLLVHELFHDFQHGQWERRAFPKRCRYPYENMDNAFLARVEEKLVARLLRLLPHKDVSATALHYLAVRGRRLEGPVAKEVQQIEFWEELAEGTAKYVEELYAAAAGFSTLANATNREAAFFNKFRPKNLQKWKYYRTGLALSMAMDRVGIDDWKEAASKGVSQYPHFKGAFDTKLGLLAQEAVDTVIDSFKKERAGVEHKMEAYVKTERDILDRWQKQGQWEVTVLFNKKGGAYYSNSGVTFNLPDCSRMVSGIISFVDRFFNFEVRRKAVVVSHAETSYTLVFYDDAAGGTFALDGAPWQTAQGEWRFGESIKVKQKSWNIDWEGEGRVVVTKGHLRIELGTTQM